MSRHGNQYDDGRKRNKTLKLVAPGLSLSGRCSGCSWCTDGVIPSFTTEETNIELAGRLILRYVGNEICIRCISHFKNELTKKRWKSLRLYILSIHPYCTDCQLRQLLIKATIVDHIIPWRYRPDLFWSEENLQPLCNDCHMLKTNTERQDIRY